MKKILTLMIITVMIFSLTACASGKTESEKINIVAVSFVEYDFTRQIVKDSDTVELSLLINSGVDIHSYQPSAKDIAKILSADLLIYNGGESDFWVSDVIENNTQSIKSICLTDTVKNRLLKVDEHDDEYDEHIWLSLKNAEECVNAICDNLVLSDSKNKQFYEQNRDKYLKSISDLDKQYNSVFKESKNKTAVFADRFAFRYLFNDYNLDYCAAFDGCSAESEVSFDTVTRLAKCIDDNKLKNVLILENSSDELANTVIKATKDKNMSVLKINSLQSVTNSQENYLDIMAENLSVLSKALEVKGE